MDISLNARNDALSPILQARKQELSNVIEIIKLVTEPNAAALSTEMTAAQHAATLKDKLTATSSNLLNNVVGNLLPAINALLGTSYVAADFQNGTIDVNALRDSMASVLSNHKLVVYVPFNVASFASAATASLDVGSLAYADATDWSVPRYGAQGAPYNVASFVPFSASFSEATRVDVFAGLNEVVDGANKIIGFVSAFDSVLNRVTVTWGYKNSAGNFVPANLPPAFAGVPLQLVVPVKSNLAIVPVDFLAFARGARGGGVSVQDINNINTVLTNNGLAIDTNLKAVLGVTSVQTTAFEDATKDAVLNPLGYSSVASGLLDLIVKVNSASISFRALFDRLNSYVGKVDADLVPTYALFGDARDVIAQGMSLKNAVEALNRAFYLGNVINVAKVGGDYDTISAAILAVEGGMFGVPSASNPFAVKVAAGHYAESITLPDYVYVCGSGAEATVLRGAVLLANTPSTGNGAHSYVSGMTISNPLGAAMTISADMVDVLLSNVTLVSSVSYALDFTAANGGTVTLASDSRLLSPNATAVRMIGNKMVIAGGHVGGAHGFDLSGAASLTLNGGDIVAGNGGTAVAVGATSMFTMNGGSVYGGTGVAAVNATIKLFGGNIDASMNAVEADALSTVELGGCAIDPAKLAIAGATVSPKLQSRSAFVRDVADYYLANNAEDVLQEIGAGMRANNVSLSDLHAKINTAEDDALAESAILQLALMPPNYTMVMVESFKDATANSYPAGSDKAVVDIVKSVLRHQGSISAYNFFSEDFAGDVAGKSVLFLRHIVTPGEVAGNGDWEIEFRLEVTGGRYGGSKSTYSLRKITAANIGSSREPQEFDLATIVPSGLALWPILAGVDEIASISIAIKQDSADVAATPVVRSFAAFI
jgi:hypothetical protein